MKKVTRIALGPFSKKHLLTGGASTVLKRGKETVDFFKPPKAPGPTAEQLAMEKMQADTLANLNNEENKRRKRMLSVGQGIRSFVGSPDMRAAPGNTAGKAAAGPAVAGRSVPGYGGGARAYSMGSFVTAMGGRGLVQ